MKGVGHEAKEGRRKEDPLEEARTAVARWVAMDTRAAQQGAQRATEAMAAVMRVGTAVARVGTTVAEAVGARVQARMAGTREGHEATVAAGEGGRVQRF